MSPARVMHGSYQFRLGLMLLNLMEEEGEIITECAIQTRQGTKVADVAWASLDCWEQVKDEYSCSVAPEICVDILPPANTQDEIDEKRALYLEAGAEELWICDRQRNITFYNEYGELQQSTLAPDFPTKLQI